MHHKYPHVLKLTYHLHNEQSILFGDKHGFKSAVRNNEEAFTRFLARFHENRQYEKISKEIYICEGR